MTGPRTWMTRSVVVAAVAAGLAACGADGLQQAAEAPRSVVAFVDVTVLPMDRPGALPGQTVVVEDGVIAAVGPAASVDVPAGATTIDGQGRYLMPGLAEMHAHVPPVDAPDRQALEDIMFLYVANGVTTIRGMLGSPYQIELADELARGEMLGPTFYAAAPSINGNSAPDPETAESLIRRHAEMGYHLQKIHPGVSRATWDHMAEVAGEVGLTFGGHVPTDVGLVHALETGMSTVDHLDGYVRAVAGDDIQSQVNAGDIDLDALAGDAAAYDAEIDRVVALSREHDVYVVPTMYLWESLYGSPDPDDYLTLPEMQYVSEAQRDAWRHQSTAPNRPELTPATRDAFFALRKRILKRLADGGVGVLMGTDSPQMFNVPGFALHRELAVVEESGMTRQQILESGTVSVSRYVGGHLGLDASFGTVATGQRADLVLLGSNPLDDLDHLTDRVGVMVRGRWIDRAAIDSGLEELAGRMR